MDRNTSQLYHPCGLQAHVLQEIQGEKVEQTLPPYYVDPGWNRFPFSPRHVDFRPGWLQLSGHQVSSCRLLC